MMNPGQVGFGVMAASYEKSIASASTVLDSKVDHLQPISNEILSTVGVCEPLCPKKTPLPSGHSETDTNTGSVGPKEAKLDEKEPETRMHNTRGRNGIKKQRKDVRLFSCEDCHL
jgi:hypothetical protein